MDQELAEGGAPAPALPAPSPIVMPSQSLTAPRDTPPLQPRVWLARMVFAVIVTAGTTTFAWNLYGVLSVETPTRLQLLFWLACTLCFAWIAIGAASAILGRKAPAGQTNAREPGIRATRTALLFPVYSEDPRAVAAAIDAITADLEPYDTACFDVFVLSDTQTEEGKRDERDIYGKLAAELATRIRIYLRWRTPNTAKKAGNIRDWITTFGGGYQYFVIFDADSVMTGQTLAAMVAAMEREPKLGLLQSVPRLVGSQTLFARTQQFAAAYYGPLVATGLAAWQGDSGNYWGHNAIIRTEAFASSAGLPDLPGQPPLGGHILSHDFVEAALLVRAGWGVRLWPNIRGSYERCPPTLSDLLTRDRRWAQGNLQHLRIVGAWRLAAVSRLHLAFGAWSYLASPVWAATLLIGLVLSLEAKFANPTYFGTEISLFPKWPVFDAEKALILFFATLGIVHLPKILGIIWAIRSRESRRQSGGAIRIVAGALLESALAALIAPILMVGQSSAILAIFSGRDSGWRVQQRAASESSLLMHARWYRGEILTGLVAVAVCTAISWQTLAWMLPVILGLVGSALLSSMTSQSAPSWLVYLLATPEDLNPPALFVSHRERLRKKEALQQTVDFLPL